MPELSAVGTSRHANATLVLFCVGAASIALVACGAPALRSNPSQDWEQAFSSYAPSAQHDHVEIAGSPLGISIPAGWTIATTSLPSDAVARLEAPQRLVVCYVLFKPADDTKSFRQASLNRLVSHEQARNYWRSQYGHGDPPAADISTGTIVRNGVAAQYFVGTSDPRGLSFFDIISIKPGYELGLRCFSAPVQGGVSLEIPRDDLVTLADSLLFE